MFDYGWRQYMPDLGKWNGIDQLAESYLSTSTYAYVANNPVSQFDVDGRWMDDNGHIDTSGNANPFRDMAQSQMRMTQFMGRNPGEGGAGGPAQGPKPTIFKRIGNFLERLFGKSKKAAVGVISVGAATFEGLAPVEFGSTVAEIAGYARLGLWSLPLMLNGDSGFSANSKPITGAIDIPVTTTADESEPEEMITLYRGVHGKHPDLINAYMGSAIPWGGPATALQHNRGDNNSMFTSWTTSISVANYSASRRGSGGIILKQTFPMSRLSFFDRHNEGEVQVFGPVFGAQTIKPWNTGTWTPYIK